MNKKYIAIIIIIVLLFISCNEEDNMIGNTEEENQVVAENTSDSQEGTNIDDEEPIDDVWVNPNPDIEILTSTDIFEIEIVRTDLTKEQVVSEGYTYDGDLEEAVYFYNDLIKYVFTDKENPSAIIVEGEVDGIRDIRVGDTFESVLSKFPQEMDWTANENGEFYNVDGNVGSVSGPTTERRITIRTDDGFPFIQYYFKYGKLQKYSIFFEDIN